jgi:hypothetical protein
MPPVASPALPVDREHRGAPLADPPVQDDAPAPGRLLTALEELGEIGQRAADDD